MGDSLDIGVLEEITENQPKKPVGQGGNELDALLPANVIDLGL